MKQLPDYFNQKTKTLTDRENHIFQKSMQVKLCFWDIIYHVSVIQKAHDICINKSSSGCTNRKPLNCQGLKTKKVFHSARADTLFLVGWHSGTQVSSRSHSLVDTRSLLCSVRRQGATTANSNLSLNHVCQSDMLPSTHWLELLTRPCLER